METLFILRDPKRLYSDVEVCELLEKAQALGFSLEKGSQLENLTIEELEKFVGWVVRA